MPLDSSSPYDRSPLPPNAPAVDAAATIRALRQQRNNLAIQMLDLEATLMMEREYSTTLKKALDAANTKEGQTP